MDIGFIFQCFSNVLDLVSNYLETLALDNIRIRQHVINV